MKNSIRKVMFRKYIFEAVLLCLLCPLCGCGLQGLLRQPPAELSLQEDHRARKIYLEDLGDVRKPEAQSQKVRELSLEEIENPLVKGFLYDGVFYYAYESLTDSEKLWYRDIEQALGTMAEKVKLSEAGLAAGLKEDKVDKIFQCVLYDHPELFYVEGYTYTQYTRAEKTVAIDFSGTYSMDREAAAERKKEIEEAVNAILEGAPRFGGDYEKTRYVYETLVRDTDYDIAADDNQNIYSVFVNRSSVCQGYAKAAQYLLNRMGIFCTLVQGHVLDTGEGHAWNLVQLDGDYYYMDTTWGDISYQAEEHSFNGELPCISYDYFCITTEQLQRTHSIEGYAQMPLCTADKDNYYVRENALFSSYDSEKLEKLVAAARRQGRQDVTLRCDNRECYEEMCDRLLERKEAIDFLSETGSGSFAYIRNDIQWTLTFFMMTSGG